MLLPIRASYGAMSNAEWGVTSEPRRSLTCQETNATGVLMVTAALKYKSELQLVVRALVAAALSLFVGQLLALPQSFWAVITALIVVEQRRRDADRRPQSAPRDVGGRRAGRGRRPGAGIVAPAADAAPSHGCGAGRPARGDTPELPCGAYNRNHRSVRQHRRLSDRLGYRPGR
jgi:hypothetical protein